MRDWTGDSSTQLHHRRPTGVAHASLPCSDPRPEAPDRCLHPAASDRSHSQGGIMSAQYVEPAPGSAMPPPRRTVIWFYRDGEIAVTNHFFHRGRDRYAIAELTELGVVRGPMHPSVLISSLI